MRNPGDRQGFNRVLISPAIVPSEGTVDGRREQPRPGKHRPQENPDTRAVPSRGLVRVDEYPNLELLCWNIESPCVTRRNAFALYERNWRLLDLANAPEHELELIDDLAREFGRGLINS